MIKVAVPALLMLALVSGSWVQAASLWERLGLKKPATDSLPASASRLSHDEVARGLKQALTQGIERAVAMLGATDGFLQDASVKIPIPENLQKVERTLRTLRQQALADQFVTTLNRAAEQAVPQAVAVLSDAVTQMTLADAKEILTSTNQAATAYFRRTSETNLFQRFLPIVEGATERTGVTRAYKQMTDKASIGGFSAASFLGADAADLDGYVTRKALDGLFLKIGQEEQRIRENPVARTTELLQKVFGAVRPATPQQHAP
jgi:hypothetical protein